MQEYRNLEPEELAADSSFQRWTLDNDPVAGAFWTEWLAENPDQKELVDKAHFLLTTIHTQFEQRISEQVPLSDLEIQQEISQLYKSLETRKPEPVRWIHFTPMQYGMAASLLMLLGLFGWYVLQQASTKKEVTYQELVAQVKSPLAEVKNTTDKPMVVNLPDRSTILLYPKSQISYARQFSGIKREVYLSGEAFFEVSKNPSRPFYVYANSLVTKVLGTSFMVQTNESTKEVKVVVKTGKVSVYAQEQVPSPSQKEDYKLGGTVLTPNQQVVFSAEDTRLVRSLVKEPALLEKDAQKQMFAFKRTPIAEVFATLEKAYSIKIIFDEEAMKDCYLTASLADEPLFDKLDLICHTINAHYDQLDAYIVVDSKGCK
ncbi:FecR family protein [Spirosoma sp. KNUC1025]|uniref:FecR family protein n=1 Tax=Spirosoma sp. KNUC1025 TaxID=2894082 RepID=UPI003864FB31|nr:FecR domain-containing protein [Spirosoma sp. KNUC1025]